MKHGWGVRSQSLFLFFQFLPILCLWLQDLDFQKKKLFPFPLSFSFFPLMLMIMKTMMGAQFWSCSLSQPYPNMNPVGLIPACSFLICILGPFSSSFIYKETTFLPHILESILLIHVFGVIHLLIILWYFFFFFFCYSSKEGRLDGGRMRVPELGWIDTRCAWTHI